MSDDETPSERTFVRKITGAPEKIPGRCGAKIPYSDPPRYCKRQPCIGRTRCKFHGGMSLVGVDHPNWKGRGWSRSVPQRLAQHFMATLNDPELTSLGSEMALIDARVGELLRKLDGGDSATSWEHIDGEVQLLRKALEDNNMSQALETADKLQDYVRGANAERETWHELHGVIEQRRRLSDTERRREEMLSATMTAKQAMAFIGALQTAINDELTSLPEVRSRLSARIRNLLRINVNVGMPRDEPIEVEAEVIDDDEDSGEPAGG